METELYNFGGYSGHSGEIDLSEYKDLHTYVERPDDFHKKLYDEKRVLNHAHFYEWDEWQDETLNEKMDYLHRLIMQEIIDFCANNNINAEYVSLDADMLMDSIKVGKWHPGTDSSLAFFDKDKNAIISSM